VVDSANFFFEALGSQQVTRRAVVTDDAQGDATLPPLSDNRI